MNIPNHTSFTMIILISIMLLPDPASGQDLRSPDRQRYLLWFTPTGRHNVQINGVALGLFSEVPGNEGQLRVNGINIEVLPFAVIMSFGGMAFTMLAVVDNEMLPNPPARFTTEIHGISISGGMLEEVHTNGLTLNFLSYVGESRGVEMSLVMNSNYEFSGVQSAMMGNRAENGSGLQVGVFNTCLECENIVQLGILNRIGRRVPPLINVSFGKRMARRKR